MGGYGDVKLLREDGKRLDGRAIDELTAWLTGVRGHFCSCQARAPSALKVLQEV